jgi:hypothetical protein
VIEPPDLVAAWEGTADPVALLAPPDEDEDEAEVPPLLHAAAVNTSAVAPARQAVRTDKSRNLTGIHLLVINRTLVGDK